MNDNERYRPSEKPPLVPELTYSDSIDIVDQEKLLEESRSAQIRGIEHRVRLGEMDPLLGEQIVRGLKNKQSSIDPD